MRYIALLRGINVGGNTMIKMAELKAVFEESGFENVTTYINSGNIVFDVKQKPPRNKGIGVSSPTVREGSTPESKLVSKIETGIEKEFGKQVPVIVREQKEIPKIIAANPFAGQFESHKEMHVLFLRDEMPPDKLQQLIDAAPKDEHYAVVGRELYCHLPMGVIDSLLGKSFIEKKLKLAVTGRNWRTVQKLAEL